MTHRIAGINVHPSGRRRARRKALLAAASLATVAMALSMAGTSIAPDPAAAELGGKLEFSDARLIIEYNATDEDVGIQLFVDGEPYRRFMVFDPRQRKLLDIIASRSLRLQGLTELFFESSEPSLDDVPLEEFLKRFPEGVYDFEGITIEGKEIEGEAVFTHAIPDGPVLLSPEEGSTQDPDDTVVSWEPVADPEGSTIEAYQVIVTELIDVRPKRSFSVHVPASVTSVTVPPEFLQSGADYEFEVLAIEAGGNQTLSASFFSTLP